MKSSEWQPSYSKWRHGGWYVDNIRYPTGAIGCVHNNHIDHPGKWFIVADHSEMPFSTRDSAARAEKMLVDTHEI